MYICKMMMVARRKSNKQSSSVTFFSFSGTDNKNGKSVILEKFYPLTCSPGIIFPSLTWCWEINRLLDF